MKKFFILLGVLACLAMVSAAWADQLVIGANTYGVTANTVPDQHNDGTISGALTLPWTTASYGKQEYREVEVSTTGVHAATGDTWDFRGTWLDSANSKLYVVAGFKLAPGYGAGYDISGGYPVGDLFIKIGGAAPNLTLDGISPPTVLNSIYSADGGYTIAVQGGTAYALTGNSVLDRATAGNSVGAGNPYLLLLGNEQAVQGANNLVTYGTLLAGSSGTDTANGVSYNLSGDYYACYDLSFMASDIATSFFHLTYYCGNDGVDGFGTSGAVPLPGALVLLGAGLVRLVAYGKRQRSRVDA